jgi:uncharacterized protein
MVQDSYARGQIAETGATAVAFREALVRVFVWMATGLAVTALVGMVVAANADLQQAVIGNNIVFFGLIILQVALVLGMTFAAKRLSATALAGMFLVYSAISGITFSLIFVVYTKESIATTFFITAGTFGATALFGATTKRDLSAVGSIAFMALIGLIIASVVNIFLGSTLLYWITTYAGVLIFVALTAYDMQKIKQSAGTLAASGPERDRWAVFWALQLYLDFINLFLYLLRIFGNRR